MTFIAPPNTSSIMDNILRPRPVKPANPAIDRTQNEDTGLKPGHAIDAILSNASRYARRLRGYQACILIYPAVAVRHRFLPMPLHRPNRLPWRENKFEHNTNIGFFPPSIIMHGSRTLTGRATIEISGGSLCCFGLVWRSWSLPPC